MSAQRNVYLAMKTLQEARDILLREFELAGVLATETVPVPDAVGRVLAGPITARLSSPGFHAAAMDGVAVMAETTFGASESRPRELILGREAHYVNTGHVLPEHTDAVIMIEHVQVADETRIVIEAPAFPWQHVRKMGEDIVATELLFPRNHVITPYCVGALLAGGVFAVPVRAKPQVLILPTGSELVDWRTVPVEQLQPGQVLETNAYVLGKLTEACGGAYERHPILGDDPDAIRQAVQEGVAGDHQIVLTVGGSSAGSEDHTRRVVAELGRVLIHGVTIMPGKPVLVGSVQAKPVIGIPGYPVSAIVAFEQFVRPLICGMLGIAEHDPVMVQVQPARKIPSKLGVEEFLRVKIGKVGERLVASPLPRGAGCITTLTEADGIIRIPNHVEGLNEQDAVPAELLRPLKAVHNTIVVVGSHDNTLDVLADQLRARHTDLTLSSSHVGSMGGLMALRKGLCHLAGSHLLNTEDGTYNVAYIEKYLAAVPVRLVHLVFREQGLIVPAGNPKSIRGIEDLAREDVSFINRQAGSGTRILLDYRLAQLHLPPERIKGYTQEEFTHMTVAAAVMSGTADVGLGIYAAAKALNLDFVPVVTEQYDLVVAAAYFATDPIQALLETIRSPEFKQRVEALGGYSTQKTGEILI